MKHYVGVVLAFVLMLGGAVVATAQKVNPASDFEYDLNSEGTGVVIQKYKGTATEVVIPSVIEDFPVVTIGVDAFMNTQVISVVMPDSVVDIAESDEYSGLRACFVSCKSLEKIILPKNLRSIPRLCFYKCKALKEIILPNGLERIGVSTFESSGVESIVIPDSVTSMHYYVFRDCKNLTTVIIGKGLQYIPRGAFSDCSALTTVTIGNGVETISNGAFKNCSSLKTITLGDGVKEIHYQAFMNCTALEAVTIGNGVEIIGHSAFMYCNNLRAVTIGSSIKAIGEKAFLDCFNLVEFNIDVEKLEKKRDKDGYEIPFKKGEYLEDRYGYGYDNYVFAGCSSLPLKARKKIRDTGYEGGF